MKKKSLSQRLKDLQENYEASREKLLQGHKHKYKIHPREWISNIDEWSRTWKICVHCGKKEYLN